MQSSPFKFLDSYTRDDRHIFFGRDREIEELYHRVFESRLLLVYGISGTGKSSLIHCGLANKFRETDWLPLVIRRGGNILESMALGIKAASLTEQQSKFAGPSDFKKAVKSLYLDHYKPVFFIFDQFEELFIFGDKEERRNFVQIVKSLIESDLQCRLIFVMREEYMAGITEFERNIPTFFSNRVRIEKMLHLNAIEAISEPCKIFNISLENGFSETLLEKLSPGGTDVELTYLQVFLDKIFHVAQKEKRSESSEHQLAFTISQLHEIGNAADLLGSFLDDQIAQMDDPVAAMSVLKAFVSGKGTKRPASITDMVENVRTLGKEFSTETVTEFIQTFVRLRVLKDKDDHGMYELRHDGLAEKVYEKFTVAEKELLELRQFIENAYQFYLKRKVLLTHDELIYISDRDLKLNMNLELRNFLLESRKLQIIKKRTVKWLTAISSFAFIIIICFLGYYISTKIAQVTANNMAIKSISQIQEPLERIKMAGKAWEKSNSVLPKEALFKAFNDILLSWEKDSVIRVISEKFNLVFDPAPVTVQFAQCSKDNRYIFGIGDSLILIWNINGKLERTFPLAHFPLIDIKISDDCKFIAAISIDSILSVWNFSGEIQFSLKIRYNELNTRQIFQFTNQNNILALSKDHDAIMLNTKGEILQTFDHHTDLVNAVNISDNNNFIATASSDKTITIWYLNSSKNKYDYYNTLNYHKDTVWSVSFSSKNVSVLSASADKNIFVGSINNENLWTSKNFGQNFKYCFAEFSKSNFGIIAVGYNFDKQNPGKFYIGKNYKNPLVTIRTELIRKHQIYLDQNWEFNFLAFSPDENYFVFSKDNKTWIGDNKNTFEKDWTQANANHILFAIKGAKPFFTSDSRYILSIVDNTIQANFIDFETIVSETKNIR